MFHSEQDSSPPTHNVPCELLRDIAHARFRRSEKLLTEDVRVRTILIVDMEKCLVAGCLIYCGRNEYLVS